MTSGAGGDLAPDADAVVPVDEVYLLAGLLLARRQRPEVEVVAGAEHMYLEDGKKLQKWSLEVAKRKADDFLERQLGEKRIPKADP
jgi:hypothetical protein